MAEGGQNTFVLPLRQFNTEFALNVFDHGHQVFRHFHMLHQLLNHHTGGFTLLEIEIWKIDVALIRGDHIREDHLFQFTFNFLGTYLHFCHRDILVEEK